MTAVTVVIPLYNKAETIVAAVESVRRQSFQDWSLIVVDDGSRDDGAARVEALGDPRIRVIRQVNAGVAAARNAGLAAAETEWVALLDADDHVHPDHLARLMALAQRHPQAVLCGAGFNYVNEAGEVRPSALSQAIESAPDGLCLLADFFMETHLHHIPFNSSAVMLRRDVALRVGGFQRGVVAGEDLLMWARMACAGPVAQSAQRTSYYVEPPMSAASRVSVIRRPQQPDVVGAALRELVQAHPERASLRLFVADWHRMRGVLFMELNERGAAVRELLTAVRWHAFTRKDLICLAALLLPAGLRANLLARRRAGKESTGT